MSKQIKSIVAQFRQERDVGLKAKITDSKVNDDESISASTRSDMLELIERIRRVRVVGQKKILLRLDANHASLLEQLKPVFGIDVTHFVNYVISEFLERNPQIKTQIRDTLKKL